MPSKIDYIEKLVAESRYFEAYHEIEEQLIINPSEERLQQLKALSLSKSGNATDAKNYFEHCWRSHSNHSESAGIMGSIYKSIYIAKQDPKYGKLSAQTYTESFKLSNSYYTGINAATMSKVTGNYREAKELTQKVIDILLDVDRDYWQEATLAEAYLLIKDITLSTEHYILAREKMGANWGAVNSVQQQLWLLDHFTHVPKAIKEFFKPPVVATFSGHMIDAPNRERPRFKPEMEEAVRAGIRSRILDLDVAIGYCSIACGSDILFIEEMYDLGKEVELFLPFHINDFIQTSVAFAGDHWTERFEAIVKRTTTIHYLYQDHYSGDNYQYHLLSELIAGAAILRAQIYRTSPMLIAAISEFNLEKKTGGVRDFLSFWPTKENINIINIDKFKEVIPEVKTRTHNRFKGLKLTDNPLALSFVLTIDSKYIFDLGDDHLEYSSLIFKGDVGDKQVYVFTRFVAILRFMRESLFNANIVSESFRASLAVGLIDNKREKLTENNTLIQAINLCSLGADKSMISTDIGAFLLAMNSSQFDISYAGQVNSSKDIMTNVYRVSN